MLHNYKLIAFVSTVGIVNTPYSICVTFWYTQSHHAVFLYYK